MSDPRYLLTVLTNGRGECLQKTIEAFLHHVEPKPAAMFLFDDGGRTRLSEYGLPLIDFDYEYDDSLTPLGMCGAHARCWQAAVHSDLDWVFHLEDDHLLLRPLDLGLLQGVLESEHHVEQMALVRTPWGAEIEHGGFIPQTPGWYQRRQGRVLRTIGAEGRYIDVEWMETSRNWSAGASLFGTATARAFPWPEEPGCETTIGQQILASNPTARFGLWGAGECWAAHIGVERAPSAHGY